MTASLADGHGVDSSWEPDPERYVLVCTNGRHDACCATYGRPLARALRESQWGDEVWECSHVGGDRFAGNVVLLPDSLYFGHCDPEDAERVLTAHDDGRLDLSRFRGRSTFRLAEQAAEHFVRAESGLDALDAVQSVESLDDGRIRVHVDAGDHHATYVVAIARTTAPSPTPLTCKGDDGLTYPAFHLVDGPRLSFSSISLPEAENRRSGEAGRGAGGVGRLEPGDFVVGQLDVERGDGVVDVLTAWWRRRSVR